MARPRSRVETSYSVLLAQGRWGVAEDGVPVLSSADKAEAIEIAHLLCVGARAAGMRSSLSVQDDDGRLQSWDVDAALAQLCRLLRDGADKAPSPSALG